MRGQRISPEVRKRYSALREEGYTRKEAAAKVGVSYDWAKSYDRGLQNSSGKHYRTAAQMWASKGKPESMPGPKPIEELCPEALRAMDDVAYFALRYFGLILMPFQIDVVERMEAWAESENEEYVVVNQAPGTGKTTFWSLILPAWLTVKRRHLRGLIGSASANLAKNYVVNLRDALSTVEPVRASPQAKKQGIAIDAVASLCVDYGRFKPEGSEGPGSSTWSRDAFKVEQYGGVTYGQKEPTWTAFGQESSHIGHRVDIAIWDDVYDPRKMRSAESRAELKAWWDDVAEARLEPGGILILPGQRLDPDDLYRHAIDKTSIDVDEDGEIIEGDQRKYHHVIYKAHYDELCHGLHKPSDPPYDPRDPEHGGCLLYPRRLGWKKIASLDPLLGGNNPNFETVYNQDDTQYSHLLVDRMWINGGTDPKTGETYPGCIDVDRDLCELPANLNGRLHSICTIDPSPTRYFAIEWWVVREDPEFGFQERYLMDLHRAVMGANDLLDWNEREGKFSGIMEDWQMRSLALGYPITHWIVEDNAAQKFMFQYDFANRWIGARNVALLKHNTNARNKADPDLGVTSIASHYKHGRVRLPYKWLHASGDRGAGSARLTVQKLIDELVVYPKGRTDDTIMAHWFMEWCLPGLVFEDDIGDQGAWRPSYLRADKVPA